jgi:threonine synthase
MLKDQKSSRNMELYSTRGESPNVNLKEAVFKGLPSDNGLFMPTEIPQLDPEFIANIEKFDLQAIAFEITKTLVGDEISDQDIKSIIEDAINFEVPLVKVADNKYCLELFHGPSLAFKDFGARFMARLMAHFLKGEDKDINILVATSGDTGSAVAQGFLGVKGIKVTILYPSGKVSDNQEKQLTTLGQNITALEVDGVFDDCQRLVKSAFLDEELTSKMNLSSANSINIARLIPQSFYYAYAYAQLKAQGVKDVVFSVPSGNFGNICGGMIVRNMGLPIKHFIAATNVNDIVPQYIRTGNYEPKDSVATISNAMDVGAPSNFPRFLVLNGKSHDQVVANVTGKKYDDDVTRYAIKKVFEEKNYVMCPHTAVAFLGLVDYAKENNYSGAGVFLSTAHPAKFDEEVSACINKEIVLP